MIIVSGASARSEFAFDARKVQQRLLGGGLVLALATLAAHLLHLEARLAALSSFARSHGSLGILVHVFAYLPAALLGFPVAPLTLAAGISYGPWAGTLLAVPATAFSASLAFLAGRALAKDPAQMAAGSGRIARLARAIGRGGFRLVFGLRLVPLAPWGVLNFAFGASPCRYTDFLIGTLLGSLPTAFAFAFAGSMLAH